MLATPVLQWYDEHGLVINSITEFICYEPVACFKDFTKEVANARVKFDKRTPSLFKFEFQGEVIVLLCSKLYICVSSISNKS